MRIINITITVSKVIPNKTYSGSCPSDRDVSNHRENTVKIEKLDTYRDLSLIRKSNWSICIFLIGL